MINELRIGNLVLTKDGITKVSDVLEVGINMIHDSWEYDLGDIEPIPLTEEWLVKFGFNIKGVTGLKGKYVVWLYDVKDYCFMIHDSRDNLDSNDLKVYSTPLANIKHVHQLQNLYFALTGEELTIKD